MVRTPLVAVPSSESHCQGLLLVFTAWRKQPDFNPMSRGKKDGRGKEISASQAPLEALLLADSFDVFLRPLSLDRPRVRICEIK